MADQPQPAPELSESARPSLRRRFQTARPFLITALVAVLISLLLQWLLVVTFGVPGSPVSQSQPPQLSTVEVTPVPPPPAPTLVPPPGTPEPADSLLRLAILDLEVQDRQLRSALFLLRAVAQLDDALVALQANQFSEADRALLLVYRSLEQAYAFSSEQNKGPIDTFRLQLSQIRDDLRLRPEGADRRLRQLRGLMLSLVDEGQ